MKNKICSFGCGQKAIKIFKTSKNYCCSEYSNQCPEVRKNNSDKLKKLYKEGNKKPPVYITEPWNKGKTYEEVLGEEKAKKLKKKLAKNCKGGEWWKTLTQEEKDSFAKNCSKRMKKRYENGWEPTCGRAPKLKYKRQNGKVISVDGSWELAVCRYLDKQNLTWKRNRKRFPYWNKIKESTSTYQPDFYIEDWSSYLEIKGYKTELDECKWEQFGDNLIVWQKQDLKKLKII